MEYNGYKPGYIYVLKSGLYYKIGYADDVEQRLKSMGSVVKPDDLTEPIALLFSFPTTSKLIAERALHELFRLSRAKGEWFKLTDRNVEFLRRFTDQFSVDEFVTRLYRVPTDLVLFTDEDVLFYETYELKLVIGDETIVTDGITERIKQERISRGRKDRANRYRKTITDLLENMSVDDMEWIYETIMLRGVRAEDA